MEVDAVADEPLVIGVAAAPEVDPAVLRDAQLAGGLGDGGDLLGGQGLLEPGVRIVGGDGGESLAEVAQAPAVLLDAEAQVGTEGILEQGVDAAGHDGAVAGLRFVGAVARIAHHLPGHPPPLPGQPEPLLAGAGHRVQHFGAAEEGQAGLAAGDALRSAVDDALRGIAAHRGVDAVGRAGAQPFRQQTGRVRVGPSDDVDDLEAVDAGQQAVDAGIVLGGPRHDVHHLQGLAGVG